VFLYLSFPVQAEEFQLHLLQVLKLPVPKPVQNLQELASELELELELELASELELQLPLELASELELQLPLELQALLHQQLYFACSPVAPDKNS
jgi:hypothetical protein